MLSTRVAPGDPCTGPASPGIGVTVVGVLIAAWCVGFALVNLVYEVTGHFDQGPYAEYAAGISVMSWTVLVLKLLGVAIALLSITRLPGFVSPGLLGALIWGAAALLGVYTRWATSCKRSA